MKSLLVIVFLLVASISASAQHRAKFWLSTEVYAGGVLADIGSSREHRERNPLLRNSKGEISVPRAVSVAVIPYALTLWLDHRHHSKAANILRVTFGSIHFGVAVHNRGVN